MKYNNFMLKLTFRAMMKHNSIHMAEVLSVQMLYIYELIIHTSLLSDMSWSTGHQQAILHLLSALQLLGIHWPSSVSQSTHTTQISGLYLICRIVPIC
jgi:hypothetical protein